MGDFVGFGFVIIGLSVVVIIFIGIFMFVICINGVVRGGKLIYLFMIISFDYVIMFRVGLILKVKVLYW